MKGSDRFHPRPNGPLPAAELYESETCGPKPPRLGLVAIGTDKEPVPVTGLAANFSPIPLIAPPPFGNEIVGGSVRLVAPRVSNGLASFSLLMGGFSLLGNIDF